MEKRGKESVVWWTVLCSVCAAAVIDSTRACIGRKDKGSTEAIQLRHGSTYILHRIHSRARDAIRPASQHHDKQRQDRVPLLLVVGPIKAVAVMSAHYINNSWGFAFFGAFVPPRHSMSKTS